MAFLWPLQHDKKIHVYGCTCAGLTKRSVFMTVVLHPTPAGGANEQKLVFSHVTLSSILL